MRRELLCLWCPYGVADRWPMKVAGRFAGCTEVSEAWLGIAFVVIRMTLHLFIRKKKRSTVLLERHTTLLLAPALFYWSFAGPDASVYTSFLSWLSVPHVKRLSSPLVLGRCFWFWAPHLETDIFYSFVFLAEDCESLCHPSAALLSFLRNFWLVSTSYKLSFAGLYSPHLLLFQQFVGC